MRLRLRSAADARLTAGVFFSGFLVVGCAPPPCVQAAVPEISGSRSNRLDDISVDVEDYGASRVVLREVESNQRLPPRRRAR